MQQYVTRKQMNYNKLNGCTDTVDNPGTRDSVSCNWKAIFIMISGWFEILILLVAFLFRYSKNVKFKTRCNNFHGFNRFQLTCRVWLMDKVFFDTNSLVHLTPDNIDSSRQR